MSTTTIDPTDALVERLFTSTIGALELYSIYLGTELGLYRALATHGPLTPPELADHAGIAPRYAVEWLEQQAVAGLLDVEDGEPRAYGLAPGHARVLASPDDAAHVAPFAHMLAGIGGVLPQVAQAYRTGGGVPYSAYGAAFRHGQGHINRPAFTHELPTDWIDAMPDIRGRLHHGGRVATSAAARASPPSPSPRRSPTHRSTASTQTPPRSPTPPATPPGPASTAASASCTPTPPSSPDRTT